MGPPHPLPGSTGLSGLNEPALVGTTRTQLGPVGSAREPAICKTAGVHLLSRHMGGPGAASSCETSAENIERAVAVAPTGAG